VVFCPSLSFFTLPECVSKWTTSSTHPCSLHYPHRRRYRRSHRHHQPQAFQPLLQPLPLRRLLFVERYNPVSPPYKTRKGKARKGDDSVWTQSPLLHDNKTNKEKEKKKNPKKNKTRAHRPENVPGPR
jgi:hypothetical protein